MNYSEPSKVDWAVAMEAVGGNEMLLVDLIEIFLEEYPKLLEAIRAAIETQEFPDLRRSAHTLKGNLRFFGETQAAQLAFELEIMGRDKELSSAMATLQQLKPATEVLIPELQTYLDKHAGDGVD